MGQFDRFGGRGRDRDRDMETLDQPETNRRQYLRVSADGTKYVDYKDVENLRRMLSPNGKLHGRKRLGTTAREQRMIAQAVKRARFMGLLPYTDATL
jgi:small subunit ribosomal protein S18